MRALRLVLMLVVSAIAGWVLVAYLLGLEMNQRLVILTFFPALAVLYYTSRVNPSPDKEA